MHDDVLAEEVRHAIAAERVRRNVSSNQELARQMGILPKHLSRWQNGHFTRLDRVLVQIILNRQERFQTSS